MRKSAMVVLATLLAGSPMTAAPLAAESGPNHVYNGGAHHYYRHHRCRGGNGAVGTVAGGVGGAVIGHAVIGGPVGLVAGAVGGGLLGQHLDKVHSGYPRPLLTAAAGVQNAGSRSGRPPQAVRHGCRPGAGGRCGDSLRAGPN